jgi:hypothetical protein
MDRAAEGAGRYLSNRAGASGHLAGPPKHELERGTLVSPNDRDGPATRPDTVISSAQVNP